jgi:hypothetical protein
MRNFINEEYIQILNPALVFTDEINLSCIDYKWINNLPYQYRFEILNKIVNEGKFLWTLNYYGLKQLFHILSLNKCVIFENDINNENELRQAICNYYNTSFIDPNDELTIRIYDIEIELYKSKIL